MATTSRRQTRSTTKTLKEQAKKKGLACALCKYSTSERKRMLMHVMRAHTKDKPFACTVCNFRTANHQSYQRHLRMHAGEENFECEDCEFTTLQPQALEHHLRTHTKEKPYACDACSFTTTQLNALMSHTPSHTGDRMYTCDLCDSNIATLKSLTEKRKACRLCRIHSCGCFIQTTVHLCVHCQKSCIERWSYRRTTIHFSLPSQIRYNYVNGVLTCHLCERTFKAKIGYISHMNSHIRKRKLIAVAETQKAMRGHRLNLHDLTP